MSEKSEMNRFPVRGNMNVPGSVMSCPWCGRPANETLYAYVDDGDFPTTGFLSCEACGARGPEWAKPEWRKKQPLRSVVSEMVARWNTLRVGYDRVSGVAGPGDLAEIGGRSGMHYY